MTSRRPRNLILAVSSTLVLIGAVPGPALAREAASAPRQFAIRMALPQAGGITVRLVELRGTLKPGTAAPHALVVKPFDRSKLPKGVAVVAAARLLKNSPPGRATYIATFAVFRAKTSRKTVRRTASARSVHFIRLGTIYVPDDMLTDDIYESYTSRILGGSSAEPNANNVEFVDLAHDFGNFNLDSVTYTSTTAFSWSADKAPDSSTAAGTVANDAAESVYQLTSGLIDEIETHLNVEFDNEFPQGSLDADSAGSKSATGTTTTTATTTQPTTQSSIVKDVKLTIYLNGFTGATVNVIATAGAPREQVVVLKFSGPDIPSGKNVPVAPGQSVPVSLTVPSTACGTWTAEIVSDNGVAVHAGHDPDLKVGWTHAC